HIAKPVKEVLKSLGWEVLSHPPYSPDLAPSDYHLFASMGHALTEQYFADFEEVKKWLDEWVRKEKQFFWNGIHKLPERGEKCIESNGQYF
ncbi:Histone-lysine N-methyltransferase SETMAR, partial [Harpegnathos saltator]